MQYFDPSTFERFSKLQKMHSIPQAHDLLLLKKAQSVLEKLAWIPGIKMIAVGNSVAMNASHPESDIDLFVVTEAKRLWLVRILLTLSLQIMHARKTSKHHAGRLCLSFFCTTEALDFAPIALSYDVYLYFWILSLKPILDFDETYQKFLSVQSWADFRGYEDVQHESTRFLCSHAQRKNQSHIVSKIYDWLDQLLKMLFLPKTRSHAKRLGNPYGIVISDSMLKFHDDDKRKEISEKIQELL